MITCGHDGQVLLWKINEESQLLYKTQVHFTDTICALNDSYFLTGGEHNSISLWSLGKKKPIKVERDGITDHFVTTLVRRAMMVERGEEYRLVL